MARRISEYFVSMEDILSVRRWLGNARKRGLQAANTGYAASSIAWAEGDMKTPLALVGPRGSQHADHTRDVKSSSRC